MRALWIAFTRKKTRKSSRANKCSTSIRWNASIVVLACLCVRFPRFSQLTICPKNGLNSRRRTLNFSDADSGPVNGTSCIGFPNPYVGDGRVRKILLNLVEEKLRNVFGRRIKLIEWLPVVDELVIK